MNNEIMQKRRKAAMDTAMRRKEEYLGARVPKELRDKVIARAKELGLPVSILIRNVLEEAFCEGRALIAKDEVKPLNLLDDVLGWEELTLNKAVECYQCGVQLHPQQKVMLGVGAAKPLIVCRSCSSKL